MRTNQLPQLALSALLLPLLPALLAAQQAPAGDQPSFHKPPANHDVVLAVTVKDKKGNLVPNLTAADFTLAEDGRPQNIKSLGQQSEMPILLGLEVDTSRTVEGAMSAERTAAEKFVQAMLPADPKQAKTNDQAFLIHFDNEVELLEDFTNSREKINRELEQMGPTSREHNSPQGPETRDNGPYGRQGQGGQSSTRPSYGGTQLYDAIYLASDELMKPKIGRKALIVFSDGVDRASKETQSEAIDSAERAGTVVYSVYFRGGEERENNIGGIQRGGGMGYPGGGYPGGGGGYPGGGYPGGQRRSGDEKAPIDGKKVMQDIATRTGGQFFEAKKSDNLADIYNQIANELHGQYVLVYTPDKADDEGGYHKIQLKAKRDDLIVTTREGYYAPGGEER
jgi:VWFA-related protein